jgi:transposase
MGTRPQLHSRSRVTVDDDAYNLDAVHSALAALGIDPSTVELPAKSQPEPVPKSYRPLDDSEWSCVERHISHAVRLMRPREAARSFIERLLICEHSGLSTRFLPDGQEATRQKILRWTLDGRLEKLAADLRAAGELDEERLTAFEALAEKARATRERIIGARGVRLSSRLDEQT